MPPFSADPADIAACRALLCGGSRSFFAASLLLPRRIRAPATALYAFCRDADDAIDLGYDPNAALVTLHERLDAAYAGTPQQTPIDRAFAAVVATYAIPKTLPAALVEGLAWDAAGRRYQSFDDLLDYAARVAGAVGVMMTLIMGVRSPDALARASDLGIAMQLTNIARDVGEDAAAGRLFLPLDWLAEAGIDPADLTFTPALATVIARLLAESQTLYARATTGIALLPLACRPGIAAAARIYAAIGDKIALSNHDSVTRRARVPGREKLTLAARALPLIWPTTASTAPALSANQFLIHAALAANPPERPGSLIRLLEIFERLERLQRENAPA